MKSQKLRQKVSDKFKNNFTKLFSILTCSEKLLINKNSNYNKKNCLHLQMLMNLIIILRN